MCNRSGKDLLRPGSGNDGVHPHKLGTEVFADMVVVEEPVASILQHNGAY